MTRQSILVVVSLLVIALSGWRIIQYRSARSAPPVYTDGYERLGRVLAEETARALGGEGTVVLVTSGSLVEGMDLYGPARLRSLQQAFEAHEGLSILAVEKTAPPEARIDPYEESLAFSDLKRILDTHGQACAIVSLVGEPALKKAQIASLPTPRPLLICVSAGRSPRLQRLVDRGLVEFAIVERNVPLRTLPGPLGDAEWFDKYYEMLTPPVPPDLRAGDG